MKTVIINKKQAEMLKEGFGEAKKEMTFFAFMSHVKAYLKELLTNPIGAQPDSFLLMNGLEGDELLGLLTDNNIIVKNEKIDNSGDKDMFKISYKIPRQNFERKIKRLYSKLFESNIVDSSPLNEEGGGATSASASGAFEQPLFGKPLRRKTVYVTQEQYDMLQELKEAVEMDTAFGDFGYDAPPFSDKDDPAYDHKNMMKKSFNRNGKKRLEEPQS